MCKAGKCALSCQAALTDCSGVCVNLNSDLANCGACKAACKAGQVCKGGKCALSCQAGLTNCGGVCVNLKSDKPNCGACGQACKAGSVCYNGSCLPVCQAGWALCKGTCVSILTDASNCGACGKTCKSSEECSAGKCAPRCGNNKTDATFGEKCDGKDLAGKTCASFLGAGATGTLTCKSDCSGFITTGCKQCEKVRLYRGNNCSGSSLATNVNLDFCSAAFPVGGSLNDNVASIRVAAGIKARLLHHCSATSATLGTYDNTSGVTSKCYNNPNRTSTSYVIIAGSCK